MLNTAIAAAINGPYVPVKVVNIDFYAISSVLTSSQPVLKDTGCFFPLKTKGIVLVRQLQWP